MERSSDLEYDNWMVAEDEEQIRIKKAFQFKGTGILFGYLLFLVLIIVSIVCNIFFQDVNLLYVGFFSLIALATVAGIGNQVKIVRQMKQNQFEVRDGFVRKINYTNRRKYSITSYEIEIRERNVIKTLIVSKAYRTFRPKEGDRVLLARPQRTPSIYFYRLLDREV